MVKNSYLAHWGIKGQKWGIRRYQNEDGTYTSEGKRRRRVSEEENYHEDYKNAHSNKPVSEMSDRELQLRLNRLNNERNYANLTQAQSKGKKAWDKVKKTPKVALAVTGTAIALAARWKQVKPLVDDALKKVGNLRDDVAFNKSVEALNLGKFKP